MAVAYWSFKQFLWGVSCGYYYIIKYNKEKYYIDDTNLFNWNTLECYVWLVVPSVSVDKYKIEDDFLKDIWDKVEIVEEGSAYSDGFKKRLEAVRNYNNNSCEIGLIEEVFDDKQNTPLKDGNAIQYISYKDFLERAFKPNVIKHFIIKYNDITYEIKYGMIKSKFKEIYPNKKTILKSDYKRLFDEIRINGKCLEEIWNDCEYIIRKHRIVIAFNRYTGTNKEFKELETTFYNVQQELIEKGKKPVVKINQSHGYHK